MNKLRYIRSVVSKVSDSVGISPNLYYELVYANRVCADALVVLDSSDADYNEYLTLQDTIKRILSSSRCLDLGYSSEYLSLLEYHDYYRDINELSRITNMLAELSSVVSLGLGCLSVLACFMSVSHTFDLALFLVVLPILGVVLLRLVATRLYLSRESFRYYLNKHPHLRFLCVFSDVIVYCESRYNRKVRGLNILADCLHKLQQEGLTDLSIFKTLQSVALSLKDDDLSDLEYYGKLVDVEFIYKSLF